MEELIKRLAELQAEHKAEEAAADAVSSDVDSMIASAEQDLIDLKDTRRILRQPQEISMGELDVEIEELKWQILNAWDGKNKKMVFGDSILKFRTTQSLKIDDAGMMLVDLIEHLTSPEIPDKNIKRFAKTIVELEQKSE